MRFILTVFWNDPFIQVTCASPNRRLLAPASCTLSPTSSPSIWSARMGFVGARTASLRPWLQAWPWHSACWLLGQYPLVLWIMLTFLVSSQSLSVFYARPVHFLSTKTFFLRQSVGFYALLKYSLCCLDLSLTLIICVIVHCSFVRDDRDWLLITEPNNILLETW